MIKPEDKGGKREGGNQHVSKETTQPMYFFFFFYFYTRKGMERKGIKTDSVGEKTNRKKKVEERKMH